MFSNDFGDFCAQEHPRAPAGTWGTDLSTGAIFFLDQRSALTQVNMGTVPRSTQEHQQAPSRLPDLSTGATFSKGRGAPGERICRQVQCFRRARGLLGNGFVDRCSVFEGAERFLGLESSWKVVGCLELPKLLEE